MFAHIRPIFIGFLSLCLGIWLAELFRQGETFYAIAIGVVLLLIISLTFFRLLFKKNKFFRYLWSIRKASITAFFAMIFGFCSLSIVYDRILQEEVTSVNASYKYVVMAEVQSAPIVYEDYISMFLTEASLTYDGSVIDLEKGIYLRVDIADMERESDWFRAEVGDTIILVAKVKNASVLGTGDVFTFAYKNDFRYIAYAEQEDISLIKGSMSGVDSVRKFIKDTIYNNMDDRYAGLAYALFIGDRSGLDYDLVVNFQATGIAHLLAISGINIAFIVVLLMWLLKLFRSKPVFRIIIIGLVLLFYCLLCDFSPSVVRASLMAMFLLVGQSWGKQGDNLNSVSLAGALLLIIDPMYLFDLSFLLSFASVFAIFMLYPPFERFFIKIGLGRFISANLAISLAAQIGTLPLIINTFGYVSVVSLLVNVIIVPFFGYLYMGLFIVLLLSSVLPFLGVLFWVLQWGLWLVDIISAWFGSWSFAQVSVGGIVSIATVMFFLLLFTLSPFCVLDKKKKVILNSVFLLLFSSVLMINYALI